MLWSNENFVVMTDLDPVFLRIFAASPAGWGQKGRCKFADYMVLYYNYSHGFGVFQKPARVVCSCMYMWYLLFPSESPSPKWKKVCPLGFFYIFHFSSFQNYILDYIIYILCILNTWAPGRSFFIILHFQNFFFSFFNWWFPLESLILASGKQSKTARITSTRVSWLHSV